MRDGGLSGRKRGECETSSNVEILYHIKQEQPAEEYLVCQGTLSDTEHYIAVQYMCMCL